MNKSKCSRKETLSALTFVLFGMWSWWTSELAQTSVNVWYDSASVIFGVFCVILFITWLSIMVGSDKSYY